MDFEVDEDAAATRWRGERMDYDLGVWALHAQALRAQPLRGKDVSAETPDSGARAGPQVMD